MRLALRLRLHGPRSPQVFEQRRLRRKDADCAKTAIAQAGRAQGALDGARGGLECKVARNRLRLRLHTVSQPRAGEQRRFRLCKVESSKTAIAHAGKAQRAVEGGKRGS